MHAGFWMIEAFANSYSGYMGWYEDHKPLKGRTLCEYIVMTIRAVVSPGFFANVGSFLGTFLYLISSSILSNVRTERAYLDYDDIINTWEPQGFVPPTYGYEASPDTLSIQVAADFCYLVSSVFYMYQAWIWFDPRELEEDSYAAITTPSDSTLADDVSGTAGYLSFGPIATNSMFSVTSACAERRRRER